MIFTLVRKSIFEQTYTFCVIILDFFARYNQSLQRESNFILFYIFNYVIFTNFQPINFFIGKFQYSRKKPSYQYHFNMQLKRRKSSK